LIRKNQNSIRIGANGLEKRTVRSDSKFSGKKLYFSDQSASFLEFGAIVMDYFFFCSSNLLKLLLLFDFKVNLREFLIYLGTIS